MSIASINKSFPDKDCPIPIIILIASVACIVPTIPGNTPSTPASAQLGTSPGGGGSGKRHL